MHRLNYHGIYCLKPRILRHDYRGVRLGNSVAELEGLLHLSHLKVRYMYLTLASSHLGTNLVSSSFGYPCVVRVSPRSIDQMHETTQIVHSVSS